MGWNGKWIIGIITILLIIATVITGKDFSYGCENSETPKCENGEYKRRMWSNSIFIGLLISSVIFLLLFGILLYFYSSGGETNVAVDVPKSE